MSTGKGQRFRQVLIGQEAFSTIERLAADRPNFSKVLTELGFKLLQLPGVGMRRNESGKTYDLAFIRRDLRRRLAFVTFYAPADPKGSFDHLTGGIFYEMRIRVRPNPKRKLDDPNHWLNPKRSLREGALNWYTGYVSYDGNRLDIAWDVIERVYHSWDS